MGTRGAYGFYKDGKDKITYNHYDSDPEWLGKEIVKFCRTTDQETMNIIFDRIIMVDEDSTPSKEQIKETAGYFNENVSTGRQEDWYSLLRGSQGSLEDYKDDLRYMIDNAEFMKDSLFCEWAYIINLTDGLLEVYRGFQKTPQKNRYYKAWGRGYYNVALLVAFPLNDIPEDWETEVNRLAEAN